MNAVERMLTDEINLLLDRVATTVPEGALEQIRVTHPTLKARLDEMESALASARASLLDGYSRWSRALDDLENLWALAAWRSAAVEESTERESPPALAA
jgi:hypothetical protein